MNALSSDKLRVNLKQKRQCFLYYVQAEPKACGMAQSDFSTLKWIFFNSRLKTNNNKVQCNTVLLSCKEGSLISLDLSWLGSVDQLNRAKLSFAGCKRFISGVCVNKECKVSSSQIPHRFGGRRTHKS